MDPIQNLTEQLSKLPGIGERTALRLVLHLLAQPNSEIQLLAEALVDVGDKVRECAECAMLTTEADMCRTCASPVRDKSQICVVASIQDLMAIDSTHEYQGLFHVLHGVLAPMEGIGPNELRMEILKNRMARDRAVIQELIIATPPTVEGEATSLYLSEEFKRQGLKISRIASGVPIGGDLHYTDKLTLSRSIALRRDF